MAVAPEGKGKLPTFRNLYPHLTDGQVTDAEDRFDRYIAHVVQVFERLRNDPTFPENIRVLTAALDNTTINGERSIKNKINKGV